MSISSLLLQQAGKFTTSNFPTANPASFVPQVNPFPTVINNQDLAHDYYERLISMIDAFEQGLEQDKEVGIRLVSFGESILIHVTDIGYYNPYLITFTGYTNSADEKAQLIQHVSQINFVLMAVKRISPERERVGFKLKLKQELEKARADAGSNSEGGEG